MAPNDLFHGIFREYSLVTANFQNTKFYVDKYKDEQETTLVLITSFLSREINRAIKAAISGKRLKGQSRREWKNREEWGPP